MRNFSKRTVEQIVKDTIPQFFLKSCKVIEFGGTVVVKIELAVWLIIVPPLWILWWWYRRKLEKIISQVRPVGIRVTVMVD